MIALITYDTAHRKTQDLIYQLVLNGYPDIHLAVIPWITRKNFQPTFKHRPSNCVDVSIDTLCERMNITFSRVEIADLDQFFSNGTYDHIMIAGAGLLPDELAKNHRIINSHPGYLPHTKGLDALKWAIYQDQPIGVTTHYISEKADEGELIEKVIVPVYREDTFHSLAYRQYETEIEMLVRSIRLIEDNKASLESLADDTFVANRRMPNRLEGDMMKKFEALKKEAKSFGTE